ncbi:MAG: ABC transporter substrate-binding protein [Methanothrix sp.]|nr:ABC transporter substrate-binding protein [Methanothrix sp.]
MRKAILFLLVLASILCMGLMPAVCAEKTITDMDGRTVNVSVPPEKVVTAGYYMPACVMAALGVGDKIVGTGISSGGSSVLYHNLTPTLVILPAINALPKLGGGRNLNVEATVALNPDLVILEKDCAGQGDWTEGYNELIKKLSLFNKSVPLVVINNPACSDHPSPDSVYKEITIIGELFDKQNRSQEIINLLKDEVALVTERTKDIKPEEQPSALIMSLQAGMKGSEGTLAYVLPDYDCGTLYPEITKIKNIYAGKTREYMSAEQLLALDPNAIILICSSDSLTTEKLYTSDAYKALQGLRAVKEKKAYATGLLETGRNNAGLEFPIEMLIEAKAVYPDRFKDINVGEQLTKHCKALYGLDDEQIKELKKVLFLDWMDKEGF